MKLYGYSERGVINAFFYDLKMHSNGVALLNNLLNNCLIPTVNSIKPSFNITKVTILIEQSFSEFGNSDVVLLIDNKGKKETIFIEAKVKTYQGNWTLKDNFIQKPTNSVGRISGLFVQLYLKYLLFNNLSKNLNSVSCPLNIFSNKNRNIGANPVVLKAVKLIQMHNSKVYYVAIVPEIKQNINNFIFNHLSICKRFTNNSQFFNTLSSITTININKQVINDILDNLYFLAWKSIDCFANCNNLQNSKDNFTFNKGQIY